MFRAGFSVLLLLLLVMPPAEAQERQFGGKYDTLSHRQQQLIKQWAAEYERIFARSIEPAAYYNKLPLSTRTTFEAVTHALSRSSLTSGSGKPYGTALDLVEMVERVAGSMPGARGDAQFRVYVYLKPGAVDKLYNSREFKRDHDNTVFHIGYPINFRQQGGEPSIQFSITRTGRRADVDVDYRPSGGIRALTSGHLSVANSDVRAGNNHERHVGRWQGFADWWKGLFTGLLSATPDVELADFTPESQSDMEKDARGPLPEMIRTYLEHWLIRQQPADLLSTVSVKAYPCVAEFTDGSHPDSKLALMRILKRMKEVNGRLGKASRLDDIVAAAPYPFPESEPINHRDANLFSIQRVHDDIVWATDCRVRYQLQLLESIPRPEHKLGESYVVSFRFKEKDNPTLLVQTWQREAGVWRLVSFDIKRKTMAPPADLLTRAVTSSFSQPADTRLESAVTGFLTTWLIDRKLDDAFRAFLPESYACDAFANPGASARQAPDKARPRRFLEEIAENAEGDKSLSRVISAAETAHPELRPLTHRLTGAFLLAQASTNLLRMNACGQAGSPHGQPSTANSPSPDSAFLAFHLSHSKQESAGVLSFYWKLVDGEWRISSYSLSAD